MRIYKANTTCKICGKQFSKIYVFKDVVEELETRCQKCGNKLIIKLEPSK